MCMFRFCCRVGPRSDPIEEDRKEDHSVGDAKDAREEELLEENPENITAAATEDDDREER